MTGWRLSDAVFSFFGVQNESADFFLSVSIRCFVQMCMRPPGNTLAGLLLLVESASVQDGGFAGGGVLCATIGLR